VLLTLAYLVASAAAPQPSQPVSVVAIVPPVSDQPDVAWLGLSLADDLETRLLHHSIFDGDAVRDSFPVSVFGWRQMQSAARQTGINLDAMLSAKDGARLGKAVGANAVFTATYWLKSSSIRVMWRLVGDVESKKRDVEIDLGAIPQGVERIFASMLSDLGMTRVGVPFSPLPDLPASAFHDYGEALTILREQSFDPRAQIVLGPRQLDEAYGLLDQATAAAPLFQRAWAARAMVSAMQGRLEVAAEEADQAAQAAASDAPAVALAQFYVACRRNDLDRAILVLGRALNQHLGFTLGLGYLGQAYLQAKRFEEAVKLFTLYGTRVPNSPWVATMRAEALARAGHNDIARSEMEELLTRYPNSLVVIAGLAARQADAWRYKEARETLAKGVALFPGNVGLVARQAQVALDEGDFKLGLALARKAAQGVDEERGEPMAGYAHLMLGRALALSGQKLEAFDAWRIAARLGVDPYELRGILSDARLADIVRDQRFSLSTLDRPAAR